MLLYFSLLFIREIKELESKSQPFESRIYKSNRCYLSVKLKNLKANHNGDAANSAVGNVVIYP